MPPIVRGSGVTRKSVGRRRTRTRRRRTMLALRLSGYGRETKRPAIGYSQRPDFKVGGGMGGWVDFRNGWI